MDAYQRWLLFRQKLRIFAETILKDAERVDVLIQHNLHLDAADLVGTALDQTCWGVARDAARKLLQRLDDGSEVDEECMEEMKQAFISLANLPRPTR